MSSWSHIQPGVPGNDAGIRGDIAGLAGGDGVVGSELSGMLQADSNVDMLSGLDMDMSSIPMDFDMDMSQQTPDFAQVTPQQTSNAASQRLNQSTAAPSSNGAYSQTPAQLQSQQPQQQQQQSPEATMTGAGAGPLPTGFGMPAQQNHSTLTEFTRRRNWSQRVLEEIKDFLHILTPDGRIMYVSPSCQSITGHDPQMLIGKFISEFVHPDDSGIFMREFNESIASGNRLRFFYRFKKDDGSYVIFECDGHPHISAEPASATPNPNMSPIAGTCRGFFMMARPYPTKNAALLDSFLEHKIENERLLKRIEELKREEAEENAEQERLIREQPTSPAGATGTESQDHATKQQGNGDDEPISDSQAMPPPAKPSVSNTALTRQNLDSALSSQKPDSIADKMSRYEANSTHLESIELLTGLRYRDGERSHGISTGDTSPALIRGDAGIAILLDRDREGPKKDKKKMKLADEYVCADCGTLDSPEWRKGPKGPKTLCNACGLRWAKKEKKRTGEDVKNEDGNVNGHGTTQPQMPAAPSGGNPPPMQDQQMTW